MYVNEFASFVKHLNLIQGNNTTADFAIHNKHLV